MHIKRLIKKMTYDGIIEYIQKHPFYRLPLEDEVDDIDTDIPYRTAGRSVHTNKETGIAREYGQYYDPITKRFGLVADVFKLDVVLVHKMNNIKKGYSIIINSSDYPELDLRPGIYTLDSLTPSIEIEKRFIDIMDKDSVLIVREHTTR